MKKTDLALAVLGLVALLVTAIAFAGSGKWTDERTVSFDTLDTQLVAQGPSPAGGAGARFNWTVPDNSTAAQLQISVSFTGQAVQGGSATITIRVWTPDGGATPDTTEIFLIPQGSSAPASKTLNVSANWAGVPKSVRDAGSGAPASLAWDRPLEILIVVSPPSDVPLASYSFTAGAAGTVTNYYAV